MRIDEIAIEHFGCYAGVVLDTPTPLTLIYGENGAGKSTVLEAIAWAFTGQARGLDARGVGVERIQQAGTDATTPARVTLTLSQANNGALFTRTRTDKGSRVETEGVERLAASLEAGRDVVAACCHTTAFLDLAHADAKAILLKALAVRIPVDGVDRTLEQVDALFAEAFEGRRKAKAEFGAIRIPNRPADPAPDVAALEAQLATLQAEERERLSRAGAEAGRREGLEGAIRHAEAGLAHARANLATCAEVGPPDPDRVDHADREAAAQDVVDAERRAYAHAQGEAHRITVAIAEIEAHDPKRGCVIDASIPCRTAAAHFAGAVPALRRQVDELLARVQSAEAGIAAALRTIDSIHEADARARRCEQARSDRDRLVATVATAETDLARLRADLAALPAPDADLSTLRARIARGEHVIREARALAAEWTAYTDAKTRATAARKRVDDLEARVELLGPKGARVAALGAALEAFAVEVNTALGPFGLALAFALDPWDLTVNGRSIARLSGSERFRVGVAVQLAIARRSGLGFVLVDGADILTPANRSILTALLLAFDGQAIVTATRADGDPVGPVDGVTIYRLTAGGDGARRAVRLEAVHA